MAVLSHMRYPGIVSVYECFPDMVEEFGPAEASAASISAVPPGAAGSAAVQAGSAVQQAVQPAAFPRYRPARMEDEGAATCNLIVMEVSHGGRAARGALIAGCCMYAEAADWLQSPAGYWPKRNCHANALPITIDADSSPPLLFLYSTATWGRCGTP